VCCTLAEDLIASVSKLVSLADVKGQPYDHIIVECSGIAEPRRIRELFQQVGVGYFCVFLRLLLLFLVYLFAF